MKVIAFGCSAPDLDTCCGNFLASLSRDGHKVSIVIAKPKCDDTSPGLAASSEEHGVRKRKFLDQLYALIEKGMPEDRVKDLCDRFGLHELFLVSDFDYSAITQKNAELLSTFRNKIEPDIVIMPFWKSADDCERILARTTLVACRGIGSVIMYGGDSVGPLFSPNILFGNAPGPYSDPRTNNPANASNAKSSESALNRGNCESFESHRLLLLEQGEIDWL
jgi:hypothetical protein